MQCRSCQAGLEPGATTCSRCGSSSTTTTYAYDEAIPYIEQVPYMESEATQSRVVDAPVALQTAPPVRVQEIPMEVAPAVPERGNGTPGWMIALLTLFSLLLIIGGSSFLTYATATANAMTPDQVYRQVTSRRPVIDDPLQDDSGNVWLNYGPNCRFSGAATKFDNLAFQAQLMIIQGGAGGLIFRLAPDSNGNLGGYAFGINTQGGYDIADYTPMAQSSKILKQGISPLLATGINQINTLTVIARGSVMYLYINGGNVGTVNDTAYTMGQIALIGENVTGSGDVAFSNVKVWGIITMYETAQTSIDQHGKPLKTFHQRGLLTLSTVFAIVTALFIAGSGALIFYAKVSYPAELSVQATSVARSIMAGQAQATALSSPQHIYAQLTGKPPTYNFPLDNQAAGQAQGWVTTTTSNTSCIFTGGAYHLHTVGNHTYGVCQNTALNNLGNFVLQVQMTIFSGFSGGIVVHSPYQSKGGYAFGFTPNGLYEADITTDTAASISSFGRANINLGIGETNLLTTIAQGSHISFYVNKQFVTAIDEGTYRSGSIGFMMSNLGKQTAGDVAFSNAQIWRL